MTQTIASNVNNTIPGVAPNDIYLDMQGNIAMSFDQDAILEECAQVARTILGEMIFNTALGIPYFETVWIGVPNIAQFTSSLRQAFLNVNGVIEVISLITSQEVDTLIYTAIIRTTFGVGTLNG